jgi:hypothetical protein
MGRSCSTYQEEEEEEEKKNSCSMLVGKLEGMRPLGKSRRR